MWTVVLSVTPWELPTNQKPHIHVTLVTSCQPVEMKSEHATPMECGMDQHQSVKVSIEINFSINLGTNIF